MAETAGGVGRTGINPYDFSRVESTDARIERFHKVFAERRGPGRAFPVESTPKSIALQHKLVRLLGYAELDSATVANTVDIDPVYVRLLFAHSLGDDELDPRIVVKMCQIADIDPHELPLLKSWNKESWEQVIEEFSDK